MTKGLPLFLIPFGAWLAVAGRLSHGCSVTQLGQGNEEVEDGRRLTEMKYRSVVFTRKPSLRCAASLKVVMVVLKFSIILF